MEKSKIGIYRVWSSRIKRITASTIHTIQHSMNIEEIKKKIQIILEVPQLKRFGGIYEPHVLEEAKVAKIEKENRITSVYQKGFS